MVRTTLGAEVDTTVTVSGSESVDQIDASSSTTVSASQGENVIVRPPSGTIYDLLALRLTAEPPAGSSSGNHSITLRSEDLFIGAVDLESFHSDPLEYTSSEIIDASANQVPSSSAAQAQAVRGLRADNSSGFLIRYFNDTDADQTQNRIIRLWVREIQVSD